MNDAPEKIWAVADPDDISAQILGDVYAQKEPDGMTGSPVEYVRADLARAKLEAAEAMVEALRKYEDAETYAGETGSETDYEYVFQCWAKIEEALAAWHAAQPEEQDGRDAVNREIGNGERICR